MNLLNCSKKIVHDEAKKILGNSALPTLSFVLPSFASFRFFLLSRSAGVSTFLPLWKIEKQQVGRPTVKGDLSLYLHQQHS